jgi:hypothetical protein
LGKLREGKWRGDHRVFKGRVRVVDLAMNRRNLRRGRRSHGRRLRVDFWLEIEGDTDRWGRLVSGREEKRCISVGI